MEIFRLSKTFPKEETYSLTDQIRRSSRSVSVNIAEGYRKRKYPKLFTLKVIDADAEASETLVWLNFALDCHYINLEDHKRLTDIYREIGKILGSMAEHPERFAPKAMA